MAIDDDDEDADDDTNTEEDRILSQVLTTLQGLKELYLYVGRPASSKEESLLLALAESKDPFKALRSAGLSLAKSAAVAEQLPTCMDVLAARKKAAESSWCRCNWKVLGIAIAVGLSMALVLLGIVLVTASEAGWTKGTCAISMFSNQTCQQKDDICVFEVMVQYNKKFNVMRHFVFPTVTQAADGMTVTTLPFPSFRCCGTGPEVRLRPSCCDFYDENRNEFCDNFKGEKDGNGNPCPHGFWPCLFRLGQVDGGQEVTQLVPYTAPQVLPCYIVAAIIMFALCVYFVGSWYLQRRKRLKELSRKGPKKSLVPIATVDALEVTVPDSPRDSASKLAASFGNQRADLPNVPAAEALGGSSVGTSPRTTPTGSANPSKQFLPSNPAVAAAPRRKGKGRQGKTDEDDEQAANASFEDYVKNFAPKDLSVFVNSKATRPLIEHLPRRRARSQPVSKKAQELPLPESWQSLPRWDDPAYLGPVSAWPQETQEAPKALGFQASAQAVRALQDTGSTLRSTARETSQPPRSAGGPSTPAMPVKKTISFTVEPSSSTGANGYRSHTPAFRATR